MSDVRSSLSLSSTKKRKKRRDLNKLLAGRNGKHMRTSSCHEIYKMNNCVEYDFYSSTDDSAALLNSADETCDYIPGSTNRRRYQKSKLRFCNQHFLNCINIGITIVAIIGCIVLTVLLVMARKSIVELSDKTSEDISRLEAQILALKSHPPRLSYHTGENYVNRTVANHTVRINLLERKAYELGRQLIKFHFQSPRHRSTAAVPIDRFDFINSTLLTMKLQLDNGTSVMKLFTLDFKSQIDQLSSRLHSMQSIITANGSISHWLFQPNPAQLPHSSDTAVLISIPEYRIILSILSTNQTAFLRP